MRSLLHIFSSSAAGGTEQACADAIGAMDASRFVHDVVFTDSNGFVVDRYKRVARRVEFDGQGGLVRTLARIIGMMSSTPYDGVIAYGGRANALCRAARVRSAGRRPVYVMALRGLRITDSDSRARAAIDRLTSKPVEFILANSHAAIAALPREYRGKPYGVAYNGVDGRLFFSTTDRAASRRLCGLPDTGRMVLSTSHLRKAKNLPLLLRGFAKVHERHRDTFLALAGDPILRSELEALASDLGVRERVHFLGRRLDIPELLRAADLFALTSDHEGMPGGLLQAMATALPVVATSVGGVPELVENDVSGMLVTPSSVSALVAAMNACLESLDHSRRLSEGALARVRDGFTLVAMGRQWNEALETALALRER
jgi:glycosyltransferase involved in cell wall biosynthesis